MGGCVTPPRTSMLVALAGAELTLGTGATTAPAPPVPPDDLFLSPAFVHWQTLAAELLTDTVFGPIIRGAAEALGKLVDRHGDAIVDTSSTSKGGTFLVR